MIIAVMGATGTGKSTIINLLSGSHLAVGEGLRSRTSKVESAGPFSLFGRSVTLVDTPGFDDTTVPDTEILSTIAGYLSSTYQNGHRLHGVIYMHRISDVRMTGISRQNFSMFRHLCGDNTLCNVLIVTNMWSEVTPERGDAREAELRTGDIFFAPALEAGATLVRHDGTLASAQAVLAHFSDASPRTLLIQQELIDEKKNIIDTSAGLQIAGAIDELRKSYDRQLARIRREFQQALTEKEEETRKEIERVRQELQERIRKLEQDRDMLAKN
ncbi:hypothetical protein PsYK624_060730 [Phanerochaete sordida]|uniref:G domain-containing protein n=1 Tax=Phanerochaete sordida TaxID=48140 RepID=A0A9P3G651_9APHY|nr:hypothetical protein PsYK624_060730 [Phanerochaete sordida]